jgi:hypothetical protein
MSIDTLAYRLGMDKAAQEIGYDSFDAFAKEAGVLGSVGQAAWRLGGRGAIAGGLIGGAAGALGGPDDQTFGQRAMRGLTHAAGGAALGGALGAGAGALGQKMYQGYAQGAARGAFQAAGGRGAAGAVGAAKQTLGQHAGKMFWERPMAGINRWAGQQAGALKSRLWG